MREKIIHLKYTKHFLKKHCVLYCISCIFIVVYSFCSFSFFFFFPAIHLVIYHNVSLVAAVKAVVILSKSLLVLRASPLAPLPPARQIIIGCQILGISAG